MIIGEKNTDLKRLTGRPKFAFLQKLGDFIETKAKKSPTLPGLVSPDPHPSLFAFQLLFISVTSH
jgi:hypothetical protein